MGAFISSPLPPVPLRHDVQQGPFALRTLLRFIATTNLAATVSPSVDFPVDAGYTTALASADFSVGTRTVSPVARFVLAIVPSLPPRRSDASLRSVSDFIMLPSPPRKGLGLRNFKILTRLPVSSLSLRPDHSLTILFRWLCQSASSVSFPPQM